MFNDKIFYSGVHIDWKGSDSDARTIAASYSHTWSDVTISSVGVSYPKAVTVNVANETQEYRKDTNDSGDFLRLRKRDATSCF